MRTWGISLRKILFLLVPFISCSAMYDPGIAKDAINEMTSSESDSNSVIGADYRFVPGDSIEIKYFYNPDLNEAMIIRPDGKIALPLIGDVDLKAKTVSEASKMIESLYAPHLKTPKITIQIRSYAAQKVYIGGEVLRPGVLALSAELTLVDAIMEAGGRKSSASSAVAVLIRKIAGGVPEVRKIALKEKNGKLSDQALTLRLQPCDVVIIPESGIAKLDRWVDHYIRQAAPFSMAVDFSYIMNPWNYTK
jgi:protein involved in polysaccharide export with SLBB domain